MHVLDVAFKDLLQITRDRKSVIFLVGMPIAFTLFMGFAFGVSEADARLPVGWIDNDLGGALGASLREMLAASDSIKLIALEGQDAERVDTQVRLEKLATAVIVPEGFSARATAGDGIPLTIIAVPGSLAGQTATTAVQSATKRLLGAAETAQLSRETIESRRMFSDSTAHTGFIEGSLAQANTAWKQPSLTVVAEQAIGAVKPAQVARGFVQASPGMIVQFAVFSLITSAMVLVLERKSKALQRMLTTPIGRAQVIAGHVLAMFVVVLAQEVLLVILGQFAFQVDYAREPAGTLVMMAALAIWSASLGLLIGASSRTDEQVVMFSLVAMFAFSALGGAWFPLEIAGKTFAAIGHVMPTAWAMDGFQNVVLRGLRWTGTLLPASILLAYAAAFFGLAVWRFRFE